MEAQAILILSGAYLGYLPEHYAEGWWAQGLVRSLLPEELAYEALFALITAAAHRSRWSGSSSMTWF